MKITIAGDYCPGEKTSLAIESEQYTSILGEIKDVISKVDYSIVNLECPVAHTSYSPIDKCGPNLKCSEKSIEALKWTGFNCVTLANNHFLDYGVEGVKDTIITCNKNSLDYVGGGINAKEASKTLYKKIGDDILAIINCCEHEFSIATEKHAGSNPLNTINQYYAITEAKKKADFVLIIIHGGVEHFWLPTVRMKELYRFFIDVGADAVVNHHQHCYSGYEVYHEKPIFYGLGNFCFDGIGSGERWSSGYMVNLSFFSNRVEFELIPYRQNFRNQLGIHLSVGEEYELFHNTITEYNEIISNPIRNQKEYLMWCNKTMGPYRGVINPLYNRFTKCFFQGFLARKILNKKKLLYTKDILVNESHIERLILMVEKLLENY